MKPGGKGAATRERIVRQSLTLFAERGVDQTSLKDIAAGVGVSEPALYRHFDSKAELIWRIFADHYEWLGAEIDTAQQAETTLRAKIDAIIGVYCHLHDTDTSLFRFMLLTQHGQLEKVPPEMNNPVEVIFRVISTGIENKDIPDGDPIFLTAMLCGLMIQPAVFRIYGRLDKTMGEYREALCDAAWAVLGGR